MPAGEHDRLWQEIDRARTRLHDLESRVRGAEMTLRHHGIALDELEPKVSHLERDEAIAEGVADILARRVESRWRVWGFRVAIGSALVAAVGTVVEIVAAHT